ncbi:negative regulator of flagellin synthesis FlgM [Paenibacillus forsythiae]|uniref:Negative regulator of flagellin synthesis n=1 Tax=Paenibacillus forsythiae TaxID=365616 RepID=A0ABU3HB64_9BACL|nr:flagellar biosynthesis anti-sigma factor FlgM [Paenibacillus forsythiae]MDT3428016.1 negative regulator of flagellin synthesis FlgM [Paenibacillus forsythiae]
MKVNDTGRVNPINPYQRSMESQRQDQMKKNTRKDEVSISTEAMKLLEAQNSGKADQERAQRIQSLKQQVSAGTYQVDASKLAEKLAPYFKQSSEN